MTGNPDKESLEIPGYEVLQHLASGGMADVYLGTQLSLSRPVAIKVLAAERTPGAEMVTRFEHEARIIAQLSHPHIVSIFDVGHTADGRLYYVMPYLPNGDLSNHPLSNDDRTILATVRALCRALGHAHKLGIVHRDVKPENVLFDKSDRPLLADFGIAVTTAHDAARVTREGSTMGSSGYMSPEQARGLTLDGRADLYSLGVVSYELLSGELPYYGADTLAVALAHVEQPIPRLPMARRRWQPFIDKAMAKSPAERFQTATEMEAALDAIAAKLDGAPAGATAAFDVVATVGLRGGLPRYFGLITASILMLIGAGMLSMALMNFFAPARSSTATASTPTAALPGQVQAAEKSDMATAAPATPSSSGNPAPAAKVASDEPAAANPVAAAPDSTDEKAKPGTPESATRLTDLAAGNVLRDRGGPSLAYVPARVTRDGTVSDAGHAFALSRYEITLRDYTAFVKATGREAAKCRVPNSPLSLLKKLSWREPGFTQEGSHPVVCVSWGDADAYVQWLSKRTNAQYRLPTHTEWAHAARWNSAAVGVCAQGNLADDKRSVFHRGDTAACSDGYANTAPVGQFKPNQLGIYDLIGNVSEWTLDCGGKRDAKKDDDGACRERRVSGSSWRDGVSDHPLDFEDDADADVGYTTIGFRVLRELGADNLPALVK